MPEEGSDELGEVGVEFVAHDTAEMLVRKTHEAIRKGEEAEKRVKGIVKTVQKATSSPVDNFDSPFFYVGGWKTEVDAYKGSWRVYGRESDNVVRTLTIYAKGALDSSKSEQARLRKIKDEGLEKRMAATHQSAKNGRKIWLKAGVELMWEALGAGENVVHVDKVTKELKNVAGELFREADENGIPLEKRHEDHLRDILKLPRRGGRLIGGR